MKKIIKEQTIDKNTKKTFLTKALEFGCFDNLDISIQNEVPQEKDGNVIIFANGNESKEDWYITYEPDTNKKDTKGLQMLGKLVKTKNPSEFHMWTCRPLQAEIAKASANQPQQPQTQDQTIDVDEEGKLDPTLKQALMASKNSPLQEISVKDCVSAINLFYQYSKNAPSADLGQFHDVVKNSVSKCARQENMKRKLNKKQKQSLNQKLDTIRDYAQRDVNVGKYKIVNLPLIENVDLNGLVKNVLSETIQLKENKLILEKICENRLKVVLENLNDFNTASRVKKVRLGFRFLKEASELLEMGVVNENLADIFQGLYGKSMEGIIGSISEPLLNSLMTKIGLDGDLKEKVMSNIQAKGSQIIPSMNDCKLLSKFISVAISEEITKKLDTENVIKSDLVNTSVIDTLKNDSFLEILNSKLESLICELYEKFTENAKNLVVRMASL